MNSFGSPAEILLLHELNNERLSKCRYAGEYYNFYGNLYKQSDAIGTKVVNSGRKIKKLVLKK